MKIFNNINANNSIAPYNKNINIYLLLFYLMR